MKKISVFFAVFLVSTFLSFLVSCHRKEPLPDAVATVPNSPPAPTDSLTAIDDWPTGDSLRVSLKPDAGALSLTKYLFKDGDVVLQQIWPDGRQQRWWYPVAGERRYVGPDNKEVRGSDKEISP